MSFPDPLGFFGRMGSVHARGLVSSDFCADRSPWNDRATEPIYPFISRIAVSLRFGGRSETLGVRLLWTGLMFLDLGLWAWRGFGGNAWCSKDRR